MVEVFARLVNGMDHMIAASASALPNDLNHRHVPERCDMFNRVNRRFFVSGDVSCDNLVLNVAMT